MAESETDAKQTESADSSTDAVEIEPIISLDGLVSTTEYQRVEVEDAGEDAKDTDPSDGKEQKKPDSLDEKKKDFHEHPRFKELIDQNNDLKRQISEIKESLKKEEPEFTSKEQPSYNNIMAMKDDDIVEEMTSNPKGFLANLANQIAHEIKQDISAMEKSRMEKNKETSWKEKVNASVQSFFADKPDGQEMMKDGRIKSFMDDNPGHNEMSAYYALSGDSNVKEQIAAAVKEAEEKIYKELKAKGKAKSASTGTGSGLISSSRSPELKNPDKFGGKENVLLKRLLARQQAQ